MKQLKGKIILKKTIQATLAFGVIMSTANIKAFASISNGVVQNASLKSLIVGDGYVFEEESGILELSSDTGAIEWRNDSEIRPDLIKTIISTSAVKNIEARTFAFSKSLISVDMPGVTVVGELAFYGCTSLQFVNMPNVTTVGNLAFFSCTSLTEVGIAEVTTIGDSAFYNCSQLTSADMAKVTTIGTGAFQFCSSLKTVTMPEITKIGSLAFYSCTSLTTIELPAKVPDLALEHPGVFEYCPNSLTAKFLNKDGTELTGVELANAINAYKNDAGYVAKSNTWHGVQLPV